MLLHANGDFLKNLPLVRLTLALNLSVPHRIMAVKAMRTS